MSDLVIFRVPDEVGEKTFVEMEFIDGVLQKSFQFFTLSDPADNYNEMEFCHIVVATKAPEGSKDGTRYSIRNDATKEDACIYEIAQTDIDKFESIVEHLMGLSE